MVYESKYSETLIHHGILGQKWGVRRFQNKDGSRTSLGLKRDAQNYKIRESADDNAVTKQKTVGDIKDEHRTAINNINNSNHSPSKKKELLREEDKKYKKALKDQENIDRGKDITKKVMIGVGAVAITALIGYGIYKYKKSESGAHSNLDDLILKDIRESHSSAYTDTGLPLFDSRKHLFGNAKVFVDSYDANVYNTKRIFDNKLYESLSKHEKDGITQYTGSGYKSMNQLLRGIGTISPYEKNSVQKYIDGCTSALEKSKIKEDMVVHRGIGHSLSSMLGISDSDLQDPNVIKSLIGTQFVDKGFVSTGGSVHDAWKGVKMHVYCPKGTKAMYVDPVSVFKGEHELLIQRNTTFSVTDVVTGADGSITNIFVEIVKQTLD